MYDVRTMEQTANAWLCKALSKRACRVKKKGADRCN